MDSHPNDGDLLNADEASDMTFDSFELPPDLLPLAEELLDLDTLLRSDTTPESPDQVHDVGEVSQSGPPAPKDGVVVDGECGTQKTDSSSACSYLGPSSSPANLLELPSEVSTPELKDFGLHPRVGVELGDNCKSHQSNVLDSETTDEKKRQVRQRNRESAQNSRIRKKMQMEELEKKCQSLITETMQLKTTIAALASENAALRQYIAVICQKPGLQAPFINPAADFSGILNEGSANPFPFVAPFSHQGWGATPKLPLRSVKNPKQVCHPSKTRGNKKQPCDVSKTTESTISSRSLTSKASVDAASSDTGRTPPVKAEKPLNDSICQAASSSNTSKRSNSERGCGKSNGKLDSRSSSSQRVNGKRETERPVQGITAPVSKRARTVATAATLASMCIFAALFVPLYPAGDGVPSPRPDVSVHQYAPSMLMGNGRSLTGFHPRDGEIPALSPATGETVGHASGAHSHASVNNLGIEEVQTERSLLHGRAMNSDFQIEQALVDSLALKKIKEIGPVAVMMGGNSSEDPSTTPTQVFGSKNLSDLADDTFRLAGLQGPSVCTEVFRLDASSINDIHEVRSKLRRHFAALAQFRGQPPGPLPLPPVGYFAQEHGESGNRKLKKGFNGKATSAEPLMGSGNRSDHQLLVSIVVPARETKTRSELMAAVQKIYIIMLRPLATYVTFACSLPYPIFT